MFINKINFNKQTFFFFRKYKRFEFRLKRIKKIINNFSVRNNEKTGDFRVELKKITCFGEKREKRTKGRLVEY